MLPAVNTAHHSCLVLQSSCISEEWRFGFVCSVNKKYSAGEVGVMEILPIKRELKEDIISVQYSLIALP